MPVIQGVKHARDRIAVRDSGFDSTDGGYDVGWLHVTFSIILLIDREDAWMVLILLM